MIPKALQGPTAIMYEDIDRINESALIFYKNQRLLHQRIYNEYVEEFLSEYR